MLARARRAAVEQGVTNASWVLGADTDLPALAALLGDRRAGSVTIGQALHWMTGAGLGVTETCYDYTSDLDLGHLVGSLYSAIPARQLPPPDQRTAFADQIRRAVAPHAPFTEHVPVRMLLGQRP